VIWTELTLTVCYTINVQSFCACCNMILEEFVFGFCYFVILFCYLNSLSQITHNRQSGHHLLLPLRERDLSRGLSKSIYPCGSSSGETSHHGVWVAKSCIYSVISCIYSFISLLCSLWPASEPLNFFSIC